MDAADGSDLVLRPGHVMELLIAPLVFVAVIIFVAYPFLSDSREASAQERKLSERERLLRRRDDTIANIKDIEMDYRMGKLSPADYESLKAEYEQRALAIFQEMESKGLDPRAESEDRES